MELFSTLIKLNIVDIYNLSKNDLKNLERSIYINDIKLLFEVPIFNIGIIKKLDSYNYFEYTDVIYHDVIYHNVICDNCSNTNIFFDINNKIIVNSHQNRMNNVTSIIKLLIQFLESKLNLNNYIEYENIITTQKFNNLYGHLKDEMFILADFYEKYNDSNFLPLINYPDNSYYKNINEINKIIFNKVINPQYIKENIKIKKLIIIEHHFNLGTFHLFPKNITNKIISHYENNTLISQTNNKIFLTRDKITWVNNNIQNNLELINISKQKNFLIINPETISINDLINYLKNTDTLIITFGSALVNLIYTRLGCNVIILKSNSYKKQSINIFRNMMKNYDINYKIITCDNNNNIETNLFHSTIDNMQNR